MCTEKLPGVCYCGHDCSRCVIYFASRTDDAKMRGIAAKLYKATFGIDLPEEEFMCAGGRSDKLFAPCRECPFRNCCREKGIDSCDECAEYPCRELSEYKEKFVNKFGQV